MQAHVMDLEDVGGTQVAAVGGKGAALGALRCVPGVRVPAGFCVTTAAFTAALGRVPGWAALLDRLDAAAGDPAAVRAHAAAARAAIVAAPVPEATADAVTRALARHGAAHAYAVRSSATTEDGADASAAGQHDSVLGVTGAEDVLRAVRDCWASLFTERAVHYRRRAGIGQRSAAMGVVVQRMVPATAAGVLFTADPLTADRTVCCVEAVAGPGDALVAGRAAPDVHRVRGGRVVERAIAGAVPVLDDAQAIALAGLGRRVEAHLGAPQDIEWCLDAGGFALVQSRPITTLFPVPDAGDDAPHVYVSVGHQQMMTDAMSPLGLSLYRLTAIPRMYEAGSRLFVDVAPRLASPSSRAAVLDVLGASDPLIGGALRTLVDRGFVPERPDAEAPAPPPTGGPPPAIATDPAIVAGLVARCEASLARLRQEAATRTGAARVDLVADDIAELRRVLFAPDSIAVITAALQAAAWLNEHLEAWLGERGAADVLTQAAPGNVSSEMGLALLDVADVVRPHPEVVAHLEAAGHDDAVLDALPALPGGGAAAHAAIAGFLDRYGMRCPGEIDLARPRWADRPATLVALLLQNVRGFAPGEARRRRERGERAAADKERDVLARLRAQPEGGERRAAETEATIRRLRTFIGYREYPKYTWMARYLVYRRLVTAEGTRLAAAGILERPDDVFLLELPELAEAARGHVADRGLVGRRRAALARHRGLTPPRVLTSEGEVVTGTYPRDGLPAGALPGIAVSAGVVEGRARVVRDLQAAALEPGDVLVTAFTDPSWSPLFVAAAALVTEVGGLMTHGAVVAREYGLPAVVGVEGATGRIRDGQRIRVHGTAGYVELLG